MKVCTRCSGAKPLSEFSPDKRNRCGKQPRCKRCIASAVRSHRINSPDAVRKTRMRYYTNNADSRRALSRKIRDRDVLRARRRCKEWRDNNPHKVNAQSAARRARARVCAAYLDQDSAEKLDAFYAAAMALNSLWRHIDGRQFEVDHIVPLKGKDVCGLHVPWNLRILPKDENRRKSNKWQQQ